MLRDDQHNTVLIRRHRAQFIQPDPPTINPVTVMYLMTARLPAYCRQVISQFLNGWRKSFHMKNKDMAVSEDGGLAAADTTTSGKTAANRCIKPETTIKSLLLLLDN
jgi:hypothetical protein